MKIYTGLIIHGMLIPAQSAMLIQGHWQPHHPRKTPILHTSHPKSLRVIAGKSPSIRHTKLLYFARGRSKEKCENQGSFQRMRRRCAQTCPFGNMPLSHYKSEKVPVCDPYTTRIRDRSYLLCKDPLQWMTQRSIASY